MAVDGWTVQSLLGMTVTLSGAGDVGAASKIMKMKPVSYGSARSGHKLA